MIRVVAAFCTLFAAACSCDGGSGTPDAGPDARLEGFASPALVCPGDPACATAGDGVLKVGAAKRVYTPVNFETFTDENMDKDWQASEPYTDLNGNGRFDAVWMFGGGRAAQGVTTDVEARAMAFIQGDMAIAIVYVDCIGLLAGDMDEIRALVADLNLDHVIIGATHAHDGPDTIGLWGPNLTTTGRQPFVIEKLKAETAAAIREAVTSAVAARMEIASTLLVNDPANPASLTDDFNKDIRDPVIFDPTLTIARFINTNTNATIGTLVNWADHPEVAHFSESDGQTLTAHYPHYLRDAVEQGVATTESKYATTDLAGLGGVTVFVQGALGGQIGSIRGTHPPGPDGMPLTEQNHEMERALGVNAAAKGLTALATTGESVTELPLSFKSAVFHARIDNLGFQVQFLLGVLGPHELAGYDPDLAITDDNTPWLPLRATYLQVGPLGIITTPGELHPELWVGGYDGADWTWGYPLYDQTKPNLPNFEAAPAPPYMRDLVLAHTGVRYPICAGVAEDYIGYIVPAYNYVLHPDAPYIQEAEGDHYEETYSVGPLVEQHAIHPILELLKYRR